MIMLKLGLNNETMLGHSNPFKMDKIVSIDFYYRKVLFEKHFSWTATIKFRNGDTEGSQKFEVTDVESDTAFADVTEKTQKFINSL